MSAVAKPWRARKAKNSPAKSSPTSPIVSPSAKVVKYREKSGLQWLLDKGKISARQAVAGKRYGLDLRLAAVDGAEPLKSCLNGEPRGSGSPIGGSMATRTLEVKERLEAAQDALHLQRDMIKACAEVCGRDHTPWEAAIHNGGGQREAERLEQSLVIALHILDRHYRLTK